jgi:phosphoribosylformylglycinamidine synthase PurS subunit
MTTTKTVHVRIMPKAGILDPQGKAITRALHAMGFDSVADTRAGKLIRLDVPDNTDEQALKRMCEELLVNTLIEDYQIEAA